MTKLNLKGKKAFIAGVGDDQGYGWAIAKELYACGASLILGVWPPILKIFETSWKAGKFDDSRKLADGRVMEYEKIYPLDAAFDAQVDVPQEIRDNKRYQGLSGYTISEVAENVKQDFSSIDILVHSLANGPEVKKPLLETSRLGYLTALSTSAYSLVSMSHHFTPFINQNGAILSLSYIASEKAVPGYGGGMSSAKAALESDTRTLAYEIGRKYNVRINCISAGPLRSRAAKAIGIIDASIEYYKANAPLKRELSAEDVANCAAFLLSPMAQAITGAVIYVDNGLNIMGMATDSRSLEIN